MGGRAGSEQLGDWARRELDGYRDGDVELPRYRILPAAICIDGADLAKIVKGQQISAWQLPDFARNTIKAEAPIPYGVAEVEKLAGAKDGVQLQHPGMPDLVLYMNSQADYGTTIHSMYWKVSPTSLHGLLDMIRTTLVSLVAEMRAAGFEDPSAEVANQAVKVVLHNAKRAKVTVNTNQMADQRVGTANDQPDEPGRSPPGSLRGSGAHGAWWSGWRASLVRSPE